MEERISVCTGGLLGLAVGDAMGSSVDKKNWDEICQSYGPNGLMGYDLQNDYAEATSYTQLAAFTGNALLVCATRSHPENRSKYIAAAARDWLKSQRVRLGSERSLCWVAQVPALRRRSCMDTRILDTLNRDTLGTPEMPVNSADGPGALTAAAAVGLFYTSDRMSLSQLGQLGAEAVALTHGAPEAFLAGAFVAYSIAFIAEDPEGSLLEHYARALRSVRDQFGEKYLSGVDTLIQLIQKAVTLTRDPQIMPLVAMTILGCTTAAECAAGMVYATLVHSGNFDEALITAVNHSGRSGAVASLVGTVMGVRQGAQALPEFYLESLEPVDALQELARDMAQGRQIMRLFDDNWDQKYVQGMPAMENC